MEHPCEATDGRACSRRRSCPEVAAKTPVNGLCAGRAARDIRRALPLVNSSETGLIAPGRRGPQIRSGMVAGRGRMAGRRGASAKGLRAKPARAAKTAQPVRASAKPGPSVPAVSPLAPKTIATLPPLAGVRLASGAAGIRQRDRADTMLAILAPGTQAAGLFTTSKTASASVEWCRTQLPRRSARALVANSGNANAFTGAAGRDAVRAIAGSAAAVLDCQAQDVFVASTGVIGEPLPAERITRILGTL